MKYYKLTNKNDRTYGGTEWGENVTHEATGTGKTLCSADVIHVYDHPLKAIMFNPIHSNFKEYHLWEVRVKQVVANDHLKVGVKTCTTIKRVTIPEITTMQRVHFAIFCALKVYREENFVAWAKGWRSGKDRTAGAARVAADAASWVAGTSTGAAARAAWSAERAAAAAGAAGAARDAAVATAAAQAAEAAEAANLRTLDFLASIKRALKEDSC